MKPELKQFFSWVERRLQHLHETKRGEIISEIEIYLALAKDKQQISYKSLLANLGDKVQFLNGFLIRAGERPITSSKWPLKGCLTILASFFAIGILGVLALYYYIDSQFDFNLASGKIKIFGQTIDAQKMDISTYSTNSFAKKYIRKQSSVGPKSTFEINLEETKTTISYHEKESYVIECEINNDREIIITPNKNNISILVDGQSNCDFKLPKTSALQAIFGEGRMTIERPISSFSVEGKKGSINWIKDLNAKFKVFYDVENAATRGEFKDIFDQNASRKANIKLQSGDINFLGPN